MRVDIAFLVALSGLTVILAIGTLCWVIHNRRKAAGMPTRHLADKQKVRANKPRQEPTGEHATAASR